MQILINGEERFYTRKLSYISKKNSKELDNLNTDSFKIGIAVTKGSKLSIKSVTGYEGSLIPNLQNFNEGKKKAIKGKNSKATFESAICTNIVIT